jgi:hypothetical protein
MRRNVEKLTKALELDRDGDWDSALAPKGGGFRKLKLLVQESQKDNA